ncbi:heme-binding protein [Ectothiorhodospiraceae bacterium BW-2]|nr:heme-binding protein [Ectothiorhodospiraceae bacterium BW-2]
MKSLNTGLTALPLLLTLHTAPTLAEEPLAIELIRLSLDSAQKIAQGTINACRKEGIHISVAIVDRDGTLQVQLRDTLAAPISLQISQMKAYTAANFNAPTSALTERANSAVGRVDGLVMSAGGVPIHGGGGQLLGAIGVSGAPAGETDEACAKAGLDTLRDDLEMEL